MRDTRILIVGAGIAGLALGRALRSRGFSPEIVERTSAWSVVGAGVYMPGNGVRALAALGLREALMPRAVHQSHQRILDHRGKLLAEVDLDRVWARVGSCVGISRADLHQVLLDGASGVAIRLGTTVRTLTQTADAVTVQFNDGVARDYDVVIGADGINSSIRRLVFGDVTPRFVGQVSWRFLAADACGITTWTAMLARNRAFLVLPVGAAGVYCYADLLSREPTIEEGREHGRQRLRTLFADFGGAVPRFLAQLDRVDAIHVAPIEEVDMDRWVDRRVVLVGDAAHATSPNMAQGAAMALEDAVILTDMLSTGHAPVDVLAAFAERRRARVRWVQARTHRRDRIRSLPVLLRNVALRRAGAALYEKDYRPLFEEP